MSIFTQGITFAPSPHYNAFFTYSNQRGEARRLEFNGYPTAAQVDATIAEELAFMDASGPDYEFRAVEDSNLSQWLSARILQKLCRLERLQFVGVNDRNYRDFLHMTLTPQQEEAVQSDTFAECLVHGEYSDGQHVLGITVDGYPAGLLRFELNCPFTGPPGQAMLHSVLIDSRWQGRGIGTAAVFLCVQNIFFIRPQKTHVELRVTQANIAAITAYNRATFRIDGMDDDGVHMRMIATPGRAVWSIPRWDMNGLANPLTIQSGVPASYLMTLPARLQSLSLQPNNEE